MSSGGKFHLYRFLDINGNIIYIGRTRYIDTRLTQQHFADNGHLEEQCYDETARVEYTELSSVNEQHIYEIYLIGKHLPKHNTVFKDGTCADLNLPELQWNEYVNNELTTKSQYAKTLYKMETAINHYCWSIQTRLKILVDFADDVEQVKRSANCIQSDIECLMNYKTAKIRKIAKRKHLPPSP